MFYSPGDDSSPKVEKVIYLVRMANAVWHSMGDHHRLRFLETMEVSHAGDDVKYVIFDALEDRRISIEDLLDWLPEYERKLVLYS
jgi:hypothetical protein